MSYSTLYSTSVIYRDIRTTGEAKRISQQSELYNKLNFNSIIEKAVLTQF